MAKTKVRETGKAVLEYLDRYPELPTRTIARILREEQSELFKSVEHARKEVRRYRGNSGKKNRTDAGIKRHFRPNQKAGAVVIPAGISQHFPPWKIQGPTRALVLSDLHVPYHDETALTAAIRYGRDAKCDLVYLNGDSIDFYKMSRFVVDPRKRTPRQEVDTLGEILDELKKHFKRRFYKSGNHEERWDTYLFTRAEDLVDFEEFSLDRVLKLEEREFTYIRSRQWANLGLLNVLHGHEMPRGISAPVNPARGVYLRLKETAMVGHFHQPSTHVESIPMKKDVAATWSTGCLCDTNPLFMPINNWRHGFAIVEVGKDGTFQVQNFQIDRWQVYRL